MVYVNCLRFVSVSIFPELGNYLEGGEEQNWMQFRALNPRGGGGVTKTDAQDFLRTIQVMLMVVVVMMIIEIE